jgi:hypothetical protein
LENGLKRYFNTIVVLGERQCSLSSDRKECMKYTEKEIDEVKRVIEERRKVLKIVGFEVQGKYEKYSDEWYWNQLMGK